MISSRIPRTVGVGLFLMAWAFAALAPGEDGCPACIKVSAQNLYQEYAADAAAAAEQYTDQLVLVDGTVREMARDDRDTLYVVLEGGESGGVLFRFPAEDAPKLGRIAEGQSVALKGVVTGVDQHVLVKGVL